MKPVTFPMMLLLCMLVAVRRPRGLATGTFSLDAVYLAGTL